MAGCERPIAGERAHLATRARRAAPRRAARRARALCDGDGDPPRALRAAGRGPGRRRPRPPAVAAADARVVLGPPALPVPAARSDRPRRGDDEDDSRRRGRRRRLGRPAARPRHRLGVAQLRLRGGDDRPTRRLAPPAARPPAGVDPHPLPPGARRVPLHLRELAPGGLSNGKGPVGLISRAMQSASASNPETAESVVP